MTVLDAAEVLAGLGLLLWGLGQWSWAASASVAGVLLLVFGIWGRRIL